jgi:hypothetical protein
MRRSLTGIIKSLCTGLLITLAVLSAHAPDARAIATERPAVLMLEEALASPARPEALCRHKEPKKHRCKHVGRATTTLIDITAKRKIGDDVAAHDGSIPCSAPRVAGLSCKGYAEHLRLSFGAVYATTRRMHI